MTILLLTDNPEGFQHITTTHLEQIKQVDSEADIFITTTPTEEERKQTEVLIPAVNASKLNLSDYPNLKWIHTTSAGVNGLPEDIFTSTILLTNSSGVHPNPISEHIFAYLLMFARGIPVTSLNQTERKWDKKGVTTFELHGKTIGIVGLGRIGKETARLAKAFQMKVLAVKTKKEEEANVDEVYTSDEIETVLKQSDFIVNCLPSTSETDGLFTIEKFKQMKQSAYFVNIGRGTTVKEDDLIEALEIGIIAGAGLDVFETEPLPSSSKLWEMKNVIITPHTAGMTPEYANRMIEIFCQNLKAYKEGKTLPNEVDKSKGY